MNYVNNWQRAVVLAVGVTSLALDLPDGTYRLTLTDSATAPTRWEIVDAVVVGGMGTLTRHQEGTTEQTWPSGSVIYCSLTAGALAGLRGVTNATVNGSGHLVLTYSDGATVDAGYVIGAAGAPGTPGAPGAPGADGRGITSATINGSGHLIINYTSGSPADLGVVVGANGSNGRGISSTAIDGSGHLIVTYTDTTTADLGKVTGENGTGTGDVVGPSASADGEVALFSGTTGKLLKRGVFGDLVRATLATGLSLTAATAVVATDSFLAALGKLQRQINDLRAVTIPVNAREAAYTLVLTDAGTMIYHPPADTTARTWTIPANSAVAFEIGAAVTFDNDVGAGAITIAINTDTLVLVGAGTTGSRTLAAGGQATAVKVSATRWRISGNGLT